jgi:hypothetical protein
MTSDTWITPKSIIDAIGISDLDPCGFVGANGRPYVQTARNYILAQYGEDGLKIPWSGSVFCNPPYSNNVEWCKKCVKHFQRTGEDVILMIFSHTSTGYFQDTAKQATGMNFLNKRVKFLNSQGQLQRMAPNGSVLIAFGQHAYQRIKRVPGLCVSLSD